jgi:hypothetical protein
MNGSSEELLTTPHPAMLLPAPHELAKAFLYPMAIRK